MSKAEQNLRELLDVISEKQDDIWNESVIWRKVNEIREQEKKEITWGAPNYDPNLQKDGSDYSMLSIMLRHGDYAVIYHYQNGQEFDTPESWEVEVYIQSERSILRKNLLIRVDTYWELDFSKINRDIATLRTQLNELWLENR